MKENNCGCSDNHSVIPCDDSNEYRICKLEKKLINIKLAIELLGTKLASQQMEIAKLNVTVEFLAGEVALLVANVRDINDKLDLLEENIRLLAIRVDNLAIRVDKLEVGSFAQFQMVLVDQQQPSALFQYRDGNLTSPDKNIIIGTRLPNFEHIVIKKAGTYRLNYSVNFKAGTSDVPDNILFQIFLHSRVGIDGADETKLDFTVDGRIPVRTEFNAIYHGDTTGLINIVNDFTILSLELLRSTGLTQQIQTQIGSIISIQRVGNAVPIVPVGRVV